MKADDLIAELAEIQAAHDWYEKDRMKAVEEMYRLHDILEELYGPNDDL